MHSGSENYAAKIMQQKGVFTSMESSKYASRAYVNTSVISRKARTPLNAAMIRADCAMYLPRLDQTRPYSRRTFIVKWAVRQNSNTVIFPLMWETEKYAKVINVRPI